MLRASCYVSVLPPHPSGCVVGEGKRGEREGARPLSSCAGLGRGRLWGGDGSGGGAAAFAHLGSESDLDHSLNYLFWVIH